SPALIEELLRMAGLLHDVGHGPFGHFFDDNFLIDYDLTHELLGQRIIREELAPILSGLRRSPSGAFNAGEAIDPEWICYLMGKTYTQPLASHPKWLPFLKPLLSGVFTADNMDYVLRDAYMCGVAVGPIDIERIIYYSFFSEKGLTLDRGGLQAFTMFLNARFYMYTNVYYHRTTRGIDLHLKEIFRDTMRIAFPYDLRKELHPYLHLTEWTLLEDVGRWHDAEEASRQRLGVEWRHILDRKLKWRMSHEVVLDLFEPKRGQAFLKAEDVEERVRTFLPKALKGFPFKIDMALQDPRPLNPLKMGDRQIYVYDSATGTVSDEPLPDDLGFRQADQRRVDRQPLPPLHARLGRQVSHALEGLDVLGSAIGVPGKVDRRGPDEDVARRERLGPREREREEDRVTRRHVRHGDFLRHLLWSPTLGHGDVVREGRATEGAQVEREGLVPCGAQRCGDPPRA